MHYLAFNKNWFLKHQSKLIWLLNHKLTKRLFRHILRIENKETINRIEPNAYWFGAKKKGREIEVKADFRTHNKYSKRLYFAFSPLWWTMHFLDWLFIDKYIPKLSFGFLTLTAYPDADAETTTVDGWVDRGTTAGSVSESFATIRTGAGDGSNDSNSTLQTFLRGGDVTDKYWQLYRTIMLFDTSSLTSSATISAADFSVWGTFKRNQLGSDDFHIGGSTPASNTALANSDYGQCGTTSFGSIAYASFTSTDTAYSTASLNASGISAVSKTGISKFSGQLGWDINNSFTGAWADNGYTQFNYWSADNTGTTNDPKLVVTYTIASAKHFALLGVG